MITLITGAPGTGKTLYCISEVKKLLNELQTQSRTLYVDGIPEFVLSHELLPSFESWPTELPDGSLMIVDEAQRVLRPRPSGSKVPEHISAFETHRHHGLDFYLITQHPNLLDANVRRLVGRHIHIRATALGRYIYEWPECTDPESRAARDASSRRRYTLDKSCYNLYKSASLHTKTKRRLPMSALILAGAVVIGIGLVAFAQQRISARTKPASSAPSAAQSAPKAQHAGPAGNYPTPNQYPDRRYSGADTGGGLRMPMTYTEYVNHWKPIIPTRAETAPAYAELAQVVSMPFPVACVASAEKCTCYTDQATELPDIDEAFCRKSAHKGIFNPYYKAERQQVASAAPGATQSSPGENHDPAGGVISGAGGVGVEGWKSPGKSS